MKTSLSHYFFSVPDPRVAGRCDHLMSDILLIAFCTYLTGGSDYQDIHLFGKERAAQLSDLLSLPNGVPSADTFERVFKRLDSEAFERCLRHYGQSLLSDLSEKQLIVDGKKLKGASTLLTPLLWRDCSQYSAISPLVGRVREGFSTLQVKSATLDLHRK